MKRSSPLKRRKPLKKSSQKRAKEMALYRKERDEFLRECLSDWDRRFCPVMWDLEKRKIVITELHHMKQRHGKLLRDQRFWLAVSAEGHRQIHNNPRLAREKGWLI